MQCSDPSLNRCCGWLCWRVVFERPIHCQLWHEITAEYQSSNSVIQICDWSITSHKYLLLSCIQGEEEDQGQGELLVLLQRWAKSKQGHLDVILLKTPSLVITQHPTLLHLEQWGLWGDPLDSRAALNIRATWLAQTHQAQVSAVHRVVLYGNKCSVSGAQQWCWLGLTSQSNTQDNIRAQQRC